MFVYYFSDFAIIPYCGPIVALGWPCGGPWALARVLPVAIPICRLHLNPMSWRALAATTPGSGTQQKTSPLAGQGSFSHHWTIWERVLALLANGQLDVKPIIGGCWGVEDWHESFEQMHGGEIVKAILKPGL